MVTEAGTSRMGGPRVAE